MTPEQEQALMATVTETHTRMKMLVNEDGSKGMVPEVKADIKKVDGRVDEHDKQINFWRGAIALLAFMIVVFGGILCVHLWK